MTQLRVGRLAAAVGLLGAAAPGLVLYAGGSAGSTSGAGQVVLVSGRDDHGLLADERVNLLESPEDAAASTGSVPDSTLVRVVDSRGEWLRVSTLEGRSVSGWVNDYYLRGTLRLVGDGAQCSVPLAGRVHQGGTPVTVLAVDDDRVRIRLVEGRGTGWVARADVRELPPEPGSCH